jgi:hypothetical protein
MLVLSNGVRAALAAVVLCSNVRDAGAAEYGRPQP